MTLHDPLWEEKAEAELLVAAVKRRTWSWCHSFWGNSHLSLQPQFPALSLFKLTHNRGNNAMLGLKNKSQRSPSYLIQELLGTVLVQDGNDQ